MSVEEHRSHATTAPIRFAVLVVSTSRSLADDRSGRRIVELLEEAGHEVLGRSLVGDDIDAIRGAVRGVRGARAIVLTGGTGLAPLDVTPEAVEPLFARRIDGFGELFRYLSWEQVRSAAMLSRATAGVLPDGAVVFALPGSVKACELAVRALILPEIAHLVSLVGPAATVGEADAPEVLAPDEDDDAELDEGLPPAPSGSLGRLGGRGAAVGLAQGEVEAPSEPEAGELPGAGWLRAVYEIGGEIVRGAREDLPQPIEKLAPVLNVLETAGEIAALRLPGGARYGLYGWPDLQRPSSKVLAVGWGDPLAEVLALHRYPVQTGTCIEEARGLLPGRHASVAEVAAAITGRAPSDPSGALFAVSGDAVWIDRGGRVFRFDGRSERNEGTPKQVLASLVLDWHAR